MSGKDRALLDTTIGAKPRRLVDDLSEVIRSLDTKSQGKYSFRTGEPSLLLQR